MWCRTQPVAGTAQARGARDAGNSGAAAIIQGTVHAGVGRDHGAGSAPVGADVCRTRERFVSANRSARGYQQLSSTTNLHSTATPGVTALALHPSNDYLLTVSLDSTWALSDARGGELLCQSTHADVTKGTAAALAGGGSAWLDGRSLTPTRCGFVPPPPPPPPPRPRDARRDRVHGGQIPPGRQAAGCRHGGRDGAHLGRPIPDDGSGLAGPPWQRDQPGVFRKRVRGMSFFLLQVTDPLGLTWPPARPAHTPRPHAHRDCRYHLAVTGENNEVKLWDLRKLANFKTLTLAANETANAVAFDHSASYLAIGGNSVQYVVAWAVAPRTRHVAQVGWLTLLTQCPVVLLDGWYPLQRVRCEAVEPARGPGRRDGRRHRCGIWRGRQVCGLHEPGPLSPLPRAMSVVVVVVVVVAGSGRDRAPRPADV